MSSLTRTGVDEICPVCNERKVRKRIIRCAVCNFWTHLSWINLSRGNTDILSVWHCRTCRVGVSINASDRSLDNTVVQDRRPPPDWPSALAKMKRVIPLQMRIPKSVRNLIAESLTSRIESALNQNSCQAWWDLLVFTYLFLRRPICRTDQTMTRAAFIRKLLNSNSLPVEGRSNGFTNRTDSTRNSEKTFARRVLSKCADGDLKSALRLLTSEDTTADSAGTLRELKAKYPAAPENEGIAIALTYLNTSPLRVEPDNVLEVLTSMQSGSGADLDGIRPLHLQELIDKKTAESGRRLLAAVTKLLNLLLSGNVPDFARDAFYGA